MSDTSTTTAHFSFTGYHVSEARLRLERGETSGTFQLSIDPSGKLMREEKKLEITLDVSVSDTLKTTDLFFRITGFFTYETEDFEELKQYVCINGPAILFPYIRAYATNITALSGGSPVVMPTLNMQPIGQRLLDSMSEQFSSESKAE